MRVALLVALLTAITLAFAVATFASTVGMPNVVACLEAYSPAMDVEVTSNRAGGRVVERHDVFGCTWYWYQGKGGGA